MYIEFKSDWINPTLEIMQCLGNIGKPIINEEIGSIDYLIEEEDSKRLIRALVDENYIAVPAYIDTIRSTAEELKEEQYDEAVILAKRATNSAFELVAQVENLDIITPNTKHNFSLIEVLSAVQKKTIELCKIKCGKAPETKDDCQGKKGRSYQCDIRRISDDATFHATMKWKEVLLEDFANLCKIGQEIET
jgi:hypothetical protein